MLDYPYSVARGDYHTLGVGPEATVEEISQAKIEVVGALNAKKNRIDKRIKEVSSTFEGLEEAYKEAKRIQADPEGSAPQDVRVAAQRLARLERDAQAIEPDFSRLREMSHDVQLSIEAVNRMQLQNPDDRLEYDRAHPPFALLKLSKNERDQFATVQQLTLPLLRRELSRFLTVKGEEVFHPSDLTREDFSADFTHHPLLDGPTS